MVAGATGHRHLPDGDRRRRRRDAADPRARGRAARARRRRRSGRGHQESTSPIPSVALIEASELLPGAEVRRRLRPDRARASEELRAALERAAWRQLAAGREAATVGAAAHRPGVHDPRRRHGRHRDAVVGCDRTRGRARRCCPAAGVCASAASRSTTSRSSAPSPDSAWRSTWPAWRSPTSPAATCSRPPTAAIAPTYLIDAELEFGAARAGPRRPRPGPPRHARDAGPPGVARRPLLAAPPRAAAGAGRAATAS